MLRRRIRSTWLDREEVSCPKCNKSDEIVWNMKDDYDVPKDEPKEVFYCRRCKLKITEQKDLQELINFVERIETGFYLRFAGKQWKPCLKCQEELDNLVNENLADLGNSNCVNLDQKLIKEKKLWIFGLYFIQDLLSDDEYSHLDWKPCQKCQKELDEIWYNGELHIGNDAKPMVEFFRKWIDDYKMQMTLERSGYDRKSKRDAEWWLNDIMESLSKLEKEAKAWEEICKKLK